MEDLIEYQINEFLYFLRIDKNYSKNTIESYQIDLLQYKEFLNKYQEIYDSADILEIHIERFLRSLKKRGLSKTTISRKISSIKTFHKYLLAEERDVDYNPSSLIKEPKVTRHLPDYLTIEEMDKLLNNIDITSTIGLRNKALLELLYASGMRVSEIIDLDINNVHLRSSYIDVIGKGNKERRVPIGENATYWVNKYIVESRDKIPHAPGGALFLNYKGKKLSRQMVDKIIKEELKKAGIYKNASAHTIRHSVATHLLQNGVDIRFIQDFLGHENVTTTQIYTHVGIEELKEKINNLHKRRDKK